MSQSDARFGYTAKMSRQDHDLGRPFGFTCAPGMLLPIHADVVSPGDTLYVKHDLPFMRTTPLAAPAMVDVKVHFETFFVPFMLIYQAAENTLTSINQQFSSFFAYSQFMNNNFPLFDYSAYINTLKTNYATTEERAEAFRLADMFGLNAENFCTWSGQRAQPWLDYAPSFFPWQILSYKAIFEYFYRLDDKSQFNNQGCNWDRYYNQSTPITPSADFMKVYSRPWHFDYFSSMYWSPIVSSANLQNVLPLSVYQDFEDQATTPTDFNGKVPSNNLDINAYSSGIGLPSTYQETVIRNGFRQSYNTAMIRQMFANEKLAMITGRSRKNYDSQILAHYGVNVPHDVKHELTLIGHDEYTLQVGEVTSLASTDDAPLGELAGKGWASSRENGKEIRQHKFTAPVHGIVMTIFSVEPLRRYYGGFEKQNAVVDAFDLPVPEFDRLGNQPVFRFEVGSKSKSSDTATDIVGWKERYYAWKRRSPRCTLAFSSGIVGQGANNYDAYMLASRPFSEPDSFFVNGATTFKHSAPSLESRYYIPFNAMDNVMLQKYGYGFGNGLSSDTDVENWNNQPYLAYIRDPFIVDCKPTVKKVSWMSKDGEPIYPY